MEYRSSGGFTPRIIIHGGAGNITHPNLPPDRQEAYKSSLLRILRHGNKLLSEGASALEAATSTVSRFEDDPLFNCGKGAVFNRDGQIELEASVMVSSGYKKRCAAVSLVRHVKNSILLVREILEHGEQDMEDETTRGENTAQGHVHVSGHSAEALAKVYGLEMKPSEYFWTRRRWEEHKRGLQGKPSVSETNMSWEDLCSTSTLLNLDEPGWDGHEYLPQGTVGCVVMDSNGSICTATSTGGLTNKLPGRIGDTPSVASGFWAEEAPLREIHHSSSQMMPSSRFADLIPSSIAECFGLGSSTKYIAIPPWTTSEKATHSLTHAVGLSGTGNGDSFLRIAACRTVSALTIPPQLPTHLLPQVPDSHRASGITLQTALAAVAGPDGLLQQSAGDRWHRTGEGEGGIIGIERRGDISCVAFAMNSSGMFRGWIDDDGRMLLGIFRGDDEVVGKS